MELTIDLRWALNIADQLSNHPDVVDIPALEAAIARHASTNSADPDNAWRAAALSATVALVRPFDGCNNEVAALFASGFLAHAGEELIVEPGDLVALMARTAAGELTVETLAAFLRNARKA